MLKKPILKAQTRTRTKTPEFKEEFRAPTLASPAEFEKMCKTKPHYRVRAKAVVITRLSFVCCSGREEIFRRHFRPVQTVVVFSGNNPFNIESYKNIRDKKINETAEYYRRTENPCADTGRRHECPKSPLVRVLREYVVV